MSFFDTSASASLVLSRSFCSPEEADLRFGPAFCGLIGRRSSRSGPAAALSGSSYCHTNCRREAGHAATSVGTLHFQLQVDIAVLRIQRHGFSGVVDQVDGDLSLLVPLCEISHEGQMVGFGLDGCR